MRMLKGVIALGVASVALVAFSAASAAAASGTASGTVHADSSIAGSVDCTFRVDYTTGGPPPSALTLNGGSFRGDGSTTACDPQTLAVSDIDVSFALSGGSYTATLEGTAANSGDIIVTADSGLGFDCTFTVSNPIAAPGGADPDGPYQGSANDVPGSPSFPCATADIAVENVTFGPLLSN